MGSDRDFTDEAWGARIVETDEGGARTRAVVGRDDEVAATVDETGAVVRVDRDDLGPIKAIALPGEAAARTVVDDRRGLILLSSLPWGLTRTWVHDALLGARRTVCDQEGIDPRLALRDEPRRRGRDAALQAVASALALVTRGVHGEDLEDVEQVRYAGDRGDLSSYEGVSGSPVDPPNFRRR